MLNKILRVALTQKQRTQGYRLVEPDDHIVELWRHEAMIARWNQTKVTIQTIRACMEPDGA